MRAKIKSIMAVTAIVTMHLSCDNEKNFTEKVQIKTDKSSYMDLQDIVITINNNSDEQLEFFICNGKQFPTYELQKFDGQWETIAASICNGLTSYCCGTMKIGETKRDTLVSNWLDDGIYRFKYSFGTS